MKDNKIPANTHPLLHRPDFRGVPGGFLGVGTGGGTVVSRRSPAPAPVSFALCTSRTARRAESPMSAGGRSASTCANTRNRSCGSVVSAGGKKFASVDDRACPGCGAERPASANDKRANRKSSSLSATFVHCSAELTKACRPSI